MATAKLILETLFYSLAVIIAGCGIMATSFMWQNAVGEDAWIGFAPYVAALLAAIAYVIQH